LISAKIVNFDPETHPPLTRTGQLFAGLLVSINSWPDSSRWLGYLSFTKYSYELFVENEFEGLVLPCVAGQGNPCTGVEVLSDKYLDIPDLGEKWKKIVALVVYTTGLMFLSYLALLRLKKRG
jgi:hypothetical protein